MMRGGGPMYFGGRPQPPREHGGVRNLPRLVRLSFEMVWTADRPRAIQTYSLQLILGVTTAVQLLITRNLIAAVIDPRVASDPRPLLIQLGLMVAIETTSQFITLYQQQQQQVLLEQVQRRTGLRVVDVASQVDMAQFDTPEFQDRLSRAQQAMGRLIQVTFSTIGLVRSLATIVGVAAALFFLQPLLLAVIVIGFVPTWLTSMAISRRVHLFTWEMTPNDRKRNYVMSLFTAREHAKEIRAFGLTGYLRQLYEQLSDERLARLLQHLRDRATLSFIGSLVSSLLQAVGYGLLAYFTLTGRLGLPEAGAAAMAAGQLRGGLSGLIGSAQQVYESSLFLYDAEVFLALLTTLRRHRGTGRGPERFGRIDVRNVDFSYPSEPLDGQPGPLARPSRPVLRNVSLEIRPGEVVALVGENGSGKTTLAKILSGLYRPDRGEILWDGVDVATMDPDELHDRVAVLFQDFARFMFTARENIGLGRVEHIDDLDAIRRSAERSGADPFIRQWDSGYETVLGPVFVGGKDISIGQWQRIALARAFFRDAELVILDEPTAALDARAEHDLFDRMRALFEGRSVLLISHRFSSVRSADRIYVLHEGEIVEHGTHAELMALGGRYADLFTMQAKAYFPDEYRTEAVAG
jgi:ABC-type multidrug transport system fused ATPase/permease subunit